MDSFQVFVSFKNLDAFRQPTRDSVLALEVFNALCRAGMTVFFSNVTLEKFGIAEYQKAINNALDSCLILVAVGTTTENLESQWVRYEWESFHNDIRSGRKPQGRIFTYVEYLDESALPRVLRQNQMIYHDDDSPENLVNFVSNALGIQPPPKRTAALPWYFIAKTDQEGTISIKCKHCGHESQFNPLGGTLPPVQCPPCGLRDPSRKTRKTLSVGLQEEKNSSAGEKTSKEPVLVQEPHIKSNRNQKASFWLWVGSHQWRRIFLMCVIVGLLAVNVFLWFHLPGEPSQRDDALKQTLDSQNAAYSGKSIKGTSVSPENSLSVTDQRSNKPQVRLSTTTRPSQLSRVSTMSLTGGEPAIREAVKKAMAGLEYKITYVKLGRQRNKPAGVNDLNSSLVWRPMYEACQGKEIPLLCEILTLENAQPEERWKAITLLSYSLQKPEGKPQILVALRVVSGTCFGSARYIAQAALRLVNEATITERERWSLFMSILENKGTMLENMGVGFSSNLARSVVRLCPPEEKERARQAIIELLKRGDVSPVAVDSLLEITPWKNMEETRLLLLDLLPLKDDFSLHFYIIKAVEMTPWDEREKTCERLLILLCRSKSRVTTKVIIDVFNQWDYRCVDQIRARLVATPHFSQTHVLARALADWGDKEAGPVVRWTINRYIKWFKPDKVGSLTHDQNGIFDGLVGSLYQLEGFASTEYLGQVLSLVEPRVQIHLLKNSLKEARGKPITDAVARLATSATDAKAKDVFRAYLTRSGGSDGDQSRKIIGKWKWSDDSLTQYLKSGTWVSGNGTTAKWELDGDSLVLSGGPIGFGASYTIERLDDEKIELKEFGNNVVLVGTRLKANTDKKYNSKKIIGKWKWSDGSVSQYFKSGTWVSGDGATAKWELDGDSLVLSGGPIGLGASYTIQRLDDEKIELKEFGKNVVLVGTRF